MSRRLEIITVIQDGNPSMDDAMALCLGWLQEGKVHNYGLTGSMAEDNMEIFVYSEYRTEVVTALMEKKYQIVEGV